MTNRGDDFVARMRADWDRRAECNAAWFVDYCHWRDEAEIDCAGEREVGYLLEGLDPDALRRSRVLEIGCGIARLLRPLARRVGQAVGVDVSGRMLRIAAARMGSAENTGLVQCEGDGSLPFVAGAFDAVCSGYVFEHLPERFTWRYLEEAMRVLRPGGWLRFQFTVPMRPESGPPPASDAELAAAAASIERLTPRGVEELACGPTIEGDAIDLDRMRRRLDEIGFHIERVWPSGANNRAVFARRPAG